MVALLVVGEIPILDRDVWFFEIPCWFGNKSAKLVNDLTWMMLWTRVRIPPSPPFSRLNDIYLSYAKQNKEFFERKSKQRN